MRFGSLFAGIGGFDLGLERAGMECKWQVEIDDFCNRVLEKHWPHVKRYRDVREVGAHNLEPVDVICGGFPCQDISTCGPGGGLSGSRSGLWREFARILGEMGPRFAVVENVANLNKRGLANILGDLANLGYDAWWDKFHASAFGSFSRRPRIFLVAFPTGFRFSPTWEIHRSRLETKIAYQEAVGLVNFIREEAMPYVCRRHDGVSPKLDESAIKALGNAVVPQIVEIIGRAIMEADAL